MTPALDRIIDGILDRELHASERGRPWAEVKARAHPADQGGWTKAGVTVATLGSHRRLGRKATREELERMSEAECREIYRSRYLRPFAFVPEPLRTLLVDWGVTTSHIAVVRALQAALQRRGVYLGPLDGILGAQTKDALVRDPQPLATYRDVLAARVRFYLDLAIALDDDVQAFLKAHPQSQLANARGWVNRCLEFLQ